MDDKAKNTHHEMAMPDHLEELEKTHTNIDVIHTTQENPYGEINFIGTYIAITLACCACFAGFIMPITSLQLIERDLGVSENAVWVALGWILLSAVSFVLLGRLSDIFGRRWFFTGCTVSALIGSIIGATASNVDVLIAASVFLGLGSAGQLSFNYSLGELVPMRHRFAVNGFIFLATLPFSGLGPYLARLMIVNTSASWRGIYYLTIALNGASTICWVLFYHPPKFQGLHRDRTVREELAELDFGGILLYVAGFFLFLLGLAWGGSVHPWTSAYVLAPLIMGFFVMVGFVCYGMFLPQHLISPCMIWSN